MKANCLYSSVAVESDGVGDHRRKDKVSSVVSTKGSAVAEMKSIIAIVFQGPESVRRISVSTLPLDSTHWEQRIKCF